MGKSLDRAYFEKKKNPKYNDKDAVTECCGESTSRDGMMKGNKEDWKWTAAKAIEVKDVEKVKYPIPGKPGEYYKHRMDMENMKDFDRERGYIDALSYIGLLPE